ncbi:hypothetical protein BABINDRAFT_175047 [Babjeviella inositovora NRRL Y-12698]|uniref:Delta(14)-sterol reductase n=1 Tax=Babjeviella inositovora NRRL Y-12698 TaxID=984486 RepID=A0A1E3QUD7_9ASCO|nr:uncharacterized protein BABINDRAFT_175047 [Babjeviella inositovora NRRL Y-12698]ODQ81280.1 hypothetical protein BABINDRAFT_175047 [Babjeviella inositovora NRRL Y-12698]
MTLLNPVTHERDFSGVPGAIGITLGLPTLIICFHLICNPSYVVEGVSLDIDAIIAQVPPLNDLFFNYTCWKAYLAWFFTLVALDRLVPGKHLQGVELRDGTKLPYKINGLAMSGLLGAVLAARWVSTAGEMPELQFIYNNIAQLTGTTIVFSFLLAVFVHVCSYLPLRAANGKNTRERILAVGGNTGNQIFDWFIGRELNPRIGAWDIKLFCELRPGMLLWLLINLACLHQQYHTTGHVNDSLVLVNALQGFYIIDGVINEEGVLTMMDITTDGFGFMLSFGDLAWVPWAYTLQARYLVVKPIHLGAVNVALIVALKALGYYIFHSSNQQKSDFRKGKLEYMESIKTTTGSKLLCDGWWSLSQHVNYLGDWLMAWAWCLPTGFGTVFTYFYVVYFGVLLVHRQTRDEAKCRAKYGKAWEAYEKRVPYKIIPYVY